MESMLARTTDVVVACDAEDMKSSKAESDAESLDARDSVESLLERGNSYQARVWDPEAYRFAEWWHAAHAARFDNRQESQSCIAASRKLYRRYATEQVHARVENVLQVPFIGREIIKQDFLSLRLLFDKGVTSGGTTYYLTSTLYQMILAFLGHRPRVAVQMNVRPKCVDSSCICPLFQHRMSAVHGRQHVDSGLQVDASLSTWPGDDSDEDDMSDCSFGLLSTSSACDDCDEEFDIPDDSSVFSSGSVSVAHDRLQNYLSSQR
eukprot:TRINITY_DN27340_c1_g6_i1.p1 TRINITY_DN27340_c1_g6~~TRINITY_DN27340_c1_g6_i1.p1  ORF type:complete len:264 (+),score=24.85 TRINITY_DN27340_c1_g6_i1:51-842(+)